MRCPDKIPRSGKTAMEIPIDKTAIALFSDNGSLAYGVF